MSIHYSLNISQCRDEWLKHPPRGIGVKSYKTDYNEYCIWYSLPSSEQEGRRLPAALAPFHSVVLDASTHEIYAFSPPKTVSLDEFIRTTALVPDSLTHHAYKKRAPKSAPKSAHKPRGRLFFEPSTEMEGGASVWDRFTVTEIVEGTMINLWYDRQAQRWEISTKTAVGGEYTYYRNYRLEDVDPTCEHGVEKLYCGSSGMMNFLDMFLDALMGWECTRHPPDGFETSHARCNLNTLNMLMEKWKWSKKCSYSFVLQHSCNSMVFHRTTPHIALVGVYRKVSPAVDGRVVIESVDIRAFRHWKCFQHVPGLFVPRILDEWKPTTPVAFDEKNMKAVFQPLFQPYQSIQSNVFHVGPGITVTDRVTGLRTKVESTVYQELLDMGGRTHSNMLFQYLCMHRTKKVSGFLQYFPTFKPIYDMYRQYYVALIFNIYDSYVSKYVNSSGEEISPRYVPHIDYLHHQVYLPSVASGAASTQWTPRSNHHSTHFTHSHVTLHQIQEYLDNLSPMEIFPSLDVGNLLHQQFVTCTPQSPLS